MNQPSLLLRRAVLVALALSAAPVTAQETEQTQESGRSIETIVVTAQKREQNLQDVPIVVTAISEQLLQDTGVKDIKDLTLLTPGLIVTSTSNESSTTARIRGIGTVGDNPGLESSVGIVIDGVYRPRNGVSFGDLGELERIEVLKGPQGTLFGKNTSAGVINVVTKKPAFDFGSDIELTAGNYGALEGSASLNGPIVGDDVAGRIFVAARERDGYLDVTRGAGPRTEAEDFDRSFYTARGQLLFKPSEAFDLRLVGDYTEREENCCAAPQAVLTPVTGVLTVLNAIVPGFVRQSRRPVRAPRVLQPRHDAERRGQGRSPRNSTGTSTPRRSLRSLRGATGISRAAQDADFTTVDILYREAERQQRQRVRATEPGIAPRGRNRSPQLARRRLLRR